MAIQRNVAQQVEVAKAAIRKAVSVGNAEPEWLGALLAQRGLAPSGGMLVSLSEVPEQGGNLAVGKWLTESGQFWEFEALLSRQGQELIEVERFENVTTSLPLCASAPGVGPSFAYLALQVLHEQRGA